MLFLPTHVPSSKNSRRCIGNKAIASKYTTAYIKTTQWLYIQQRNRFKAHLLGLTPPYFVEFHFGRDSNRRFDFINALQIVQDCMVRHEWLEDDNTNILVPLPMISEGKCHHLFPEKPGVWINVLKPSLQEPLVLSRYPWEHLIAVAQGV